MIVVMGRQIRLPYIGNVLSFLAKDAEQRQRTENPRYVRRVASGMREVDTATVSPQQILDCPRLSSELRNHITYSSTFLNERIGCRLTFWFCTW